LGGFSTIAGGDQSVDMPPRRQHHERIVPLVGKYESQRTEGLSTMADAEKWQVAVGEQRTGPFGFDQLSQMIAEGRVPADALVWKPGMEKWRRWTRLPEFADLGATVGTPETETALGTRVIDYLLFRSMIVPIIIQVVFWLGVVICVFAGLAAIVGGIADNKFIAVLAGFFVLVGGPLLARIYCEIIIVFFRINETLTDIKNAQLKR
jgi:hypothetical protein